jgi:hypothetical protein
MKKILDRSELMDNMLFPENCPSLVIVPSNKEGTGFLNHCYDSRFLTDYITEQEFNAIVLITSKIAARAYSKKKMLDKMGVPKYTKIALLFSSLLATTSLFTILYSILDSSNDNTLLIVSHVLIAPSLIMMFIIAIYNWKREVKRPPSFNEMVKHDLDSFFEKMNIDFKL